MLTQSKRDWMQHGRRSPRESAAISSPCLLHPSMRRDRRASATLVPIKTHLWRIQRATSYEVNATRSNNQHKEVFVRVAFLWSFSVLHLQTIMPWCCMMHAPQLRRAARGQLPIHGVFVLSCTLTLATPQRQPFFDSFPK